MDLKAKALVKQYVFEHIDQTDKNIVAFDVFIVWKCKILQNWKFLISTTLPDGMYYEITYNGDKDEWYLDAYKNLVVLLVDLERFISVQMERFMIWKSKILAQETD